VLALMISWRQWRLRYYRDNNFWEHWTFGQRVDKSQVT